MNNFEKVQLCYTDVLDTACDLSAMLKEENDIVEFGDILDALDKTTIILKRIGDTVLIDQVEQKEGGEEE
jgi:hypothetical protein